MSPVPSESPGRGQRGGILDRLFDGEPKNVRKKTLGTTFHHSATRAPAVGWLLAARR